MHWYQIIPLAALYVLVGLAVGLYLVRRLAYHEGLCKTRETIHWSERTKCWCHQGIDDNDFPLLGFCYFVAHGSFILWPINLVFLWILFPAYRAWKMTLKGIGKGLGFVFIPAWKFICSRYEVAIQEGSSDAERELSIRRQLEELRKAKKAEDERNKKVDEVIARTDKLLERAGDYSDIGPE